MQQEETGPMLNTDQDATETGPRKRKEQAEQTREALIDAAAVEFAIHGVGGARNEDIVKRAGVTKGALYHHFVHKENIATLLIDGKYDIWPGIVAEVRAGQLRGLAAIREIVRRVATHVSTDIRVRAAMRITREMNAGRPYETPFIRWEDTFLNFLQQSIADREISEEMDIRVTARVIVHCAWGVMNASEESGTGDHVEQLLDDMWDRLFGGLRMPDVRSV
jgi:AcrR family transcriptional regulator